MSALLEAELLKLRTTRTFVALVAAAVTLSLLVVVITLLLSDRLTSAEMRDTLTADFTSLFILLLGVIGMTGEWRHRTITSTVLAAPDRMRLLAAKLLAYAAAGALLSLAVTLATAIVGAVLASTQGHESLEVSDMLDVLWRNVVVAALLGAFGVCIGAIVRNQVVAMIGLLFFAFIVEPLVLALAFDVGRFGPTVGAPAGVQDLPDFTDGEELLAPAAAALVMLAWIGVLFAAAAALLRGRDLT